MTTPSSGPISIQSIVDEFGGTAPHSLSEYYGVAAGVPASGQISLYDFYGKSNTYSIQYLVIAGAGAGGGLYNGPGGGAGGYLSNTANFVPGAAYTVTVGAGGASAPDGGGNKGANSSISGTGVSVLSYGGGSQGQTGPFGSACGLQSNQTAGQGNAGGVQNFTCCWNHSNGGGGGSGGAGSGINGGAGTAWYDGVTRAGGGGGGVYPEYAGPGQGAAGGGNGGFRGGSAPTAGGANTGSGGGGSSHGGGSTAGGSGIVIIRYAGSQRGTGGTVTSSGGYTYHKFTSSGTYTA